VFLLVLEDEDDDENEDEPPKSDFGLIKTRLEAETFQQSLDLGDLDAITRSDGNIERGIRNYFLDVYD
jgi:hypothetical protein